MTLTDEDVLPGDPALLDGLADLTLIPVHLRRVNVPVPGFKRDLDSLLGVVVLVYAQAEERHQVPCICNVFHVMSRCACAYDSLRTELLPEDRRTVELIVSGLAMFVEEFWRVGGSDTER